MGDDFLDGLFDDPKPKVEPKPAPKPIPKEEKQPEPKSEPKVEPKKEPKKAEVPETKQKVESVAPKQPPTPIPSWVTADNETILIFGLPKHGKTYAYCSIIEDVLERKKGSVYIISTDSGFARTANAYFGPRFKDVWGNIHVEIVFNINGIRNYYDKIRPTLKPNDLLVIDLVSDVWEWAQIDFVEKLTPGGDITGFVADAMRDVKKFGLFDDNKWNYIKALHKFVEDIIIRKPCSFIGVATEKDTDVEEIKGKKKAEVMLDDLGYEDLGVRAGGNKLLPYKFETVMRVGFDKGRYFMQVVGDRGYNKDLTKQYYDKNMYKKLIDWRNKQKVEL
jgi:hypothetical protein